MAFSLLVGQKSRELRDLQVPTGEIKNLVRHADDSYYLQFTTMQSLDLFALASRFKINFTEP